MNIKGKLIEIFETKQISDKFKKREFVVEYAENEKYPQFIKFELIQNSCDLIDGFNKGDTVDVHFNLRGNKWTNKQEEVSYFTSLSAWKIQAADESQDNITHDEAPPETSPDEEYPF
ncbi:MAG TPA: DUF3127 domain-containing protein [Ignavibacteria bacterium]|nr:DUF3127 domain-containing protein [Ignavibacteria bacterium]HMR40589.1 DUF3127 domain-containing protein [Ignavibacteria bacterium]